MRDNIRARLPLAELVDQSQGAEQAMRWGWHVMHKGCPARDVLRLYRQYAIMGVNEGIQTIRAGGARRCGWRAWGRLRQGHTVCARRAHQRDHAQPADAAGARRAQHHHAVGAMTMAAARLYTRGLWGGLLGAACVRAVASLLANGTFAVSVITDNLWDGVASNGVVHVNRTQQDILIDGTFPQAKWFGASPCYADVTGDNIPELVVGDGHGFVWVYERVNPRTVFPPRFGPGKFLHAFFGYAIVIDVADYNGDGLNDLIIGTPEGAIQIVRNLGGGAFVPDHTTLSYAALDWVKLRTRQPVDTSRCFPLVMRGTLPLCVGSFVAPRLVDWDRDGRPDMIVGEGSYSANSIYLFLNHGTRQAPNFAQSPQHWLAYGHGREHLTPTVGDLDGDGDLDVLAGERTGLLTWYENTPRPGASDTPYLLTPKDRPVQVGGADVPAGEFPRPYLADLDADGDLDLLLGCGDGRVLVSRNIGTRFAPVFAAPQPVPASDVRTPYRIPPWPWEIVRAANDNAAIMMESHRDQDAAVDAPRTFVRVSFVDGYTSEGGALFHHGHATVAYDRTYALTFQARGRAVDVTCHLKQGGEDEVVGDTLYTRFGGGAQFPVRLAAEWQPYRYTFRLSRLTAGARTNTVTGVALDFGVRATARDAVFDLTDVALVPAD